MLQQICLKGYFMGIGCPSPTFYDLHGNRSSVTNRKVNLTSRATFPLSRASLVSALKNKLDTLFLSLVTLFPFQTQCYSISHSIPITTPHNIPKCLSPFVPPPGCPINRTSTHPPTNRLCGWQSINQSENALWRLR